MLLVAFSRRMCCSRVCIAMRSAWLPRRVDRHADDAPGHRALVLVAGGEVGGMRAAEAHRHAEALGVADHHVGTHLAGGFSAAAGSSDPQRPPRPARRLACTCAIRSVRSSHAAVGAGVLQQQRRRRRYRRVRCRGRRPPPRARAPRRGCAPRRWSAGGSPCHEEGVRCVLVAPRACSSVMASAAAVPSSSSEALASSMPVRSMIICWKFSRPSSRPCEISGW